MAWPKAGARLPAGCTPTSASAGMDMAVNMNFKPKVPPDHMQHALEAHFSIAKIAVLIWLYALHTVQRQTKAVGFQFASGKVIPLVADTADKTGTEALRPTWNRAASPGSRPHWPDAGWCRGSGRPWRRERWRRTAMRPRPAPPARQAGPAAGPERGWRLE